MEISQIGEFGLIDLIRKKILSEDKRVLVNIGDDAAVLKLSRDKLLIFTADAMVENVHFDLSYCTFEEIGWKAMAANLSDVAAMGGLPRYALVTLGLTKSAHAEDVLSIYRGASRLAKQYGCRIIGGDTTLVLKDLVIWIALLGEVEKKCLVTRSGAKRGDLICVTGNLGEAQAGLEYLKRYGRIKPSMVKKHLRPDPRVNQARILTGNLRVNSMIDISDGLSSELFHLAEQSRVGAVIHEDKIPVSPRCRKAAALMNKSPLDWALSSGEEYELLFTVNRKDRRRIGRIKSQVDVSVIGETTERKHGVRLLQKSGKAKHLRRSGFAHF